jgi:hypothetical protein
MQFRNTVWIGKIITPTGNGKDRDLPNPPERPIWKDWLRLLSYPLHDLQRKFAQVVKSSWISLYRDTAWFS